MGASSTRTDFSEECRERTRESRPRTVKIGDRKNELRLAVPHDRDLLFPSNGSGLYFCKRLLGAEISQHSLYPYYLYPKNMLLHPPFPSILGYIHLQGAPNLPAAIPLGGPLCHGAFEHISGDCGISLYCQSKNNRCKAEEPYFTSHYRFRFSRHNHVQQPAAVHLPRADSNQCYNSCT
jgi:hypothetical protein